ncbi:hypothetical protein ES708_34971 [subsurface metagenome]
MTTDIPEGILTPDKVETSIGTLEYFDGVPTKATTENVYNYLDRMRGVDAFLKGIPGASVRGLIMGVKNMGGNGFNKIYITETLLDSKSLFLTANTSTIYISPYIDLKENGPMVMEVPSGMLGAFNDAYCGELLIGLQHGAGLRIVNCNRPEIVDWHIRRNMQLIGSTAIKRIFICI